jgi:hypothetical protein
MPTIEMQLTVHVDHYTGPVISDPQHLANWLVDERQDFDAPAGHILYWICPACLDPEECDHDREEASRYRMTVVTVESAEQQPEWTPATTRPICQNSLRDALKGR